MKWARAWVRLVLITAVVLDFAAPLAQAGARRAPAADRSEAAAACAALALKNAVVSAERCRRACSERLSLASLTAIAAVTEWLDRVGALQVTVLAAGDDR